MNKTQKTKVVTFSILGVAALSLIGAGAAAWIIASITPATTGSFTVTAGNVTDQSVAISNINITDSTIVFDAEAGDTTGPIVSDGTTTPSLDFAFTFQVSYPNHCSAINAKWTIDSALQTALTNNYLVGPLSTSDVAIGLPSGLTAGTYYDGSTTVKTDFKEKLVSAINGDTATITATYQFAWGSAFGGQNPSVYATDANLATVRTALETLHNADNKTFNITLTPVWKA